MNDKNTAPENGSGDDSQNNESEDKGVGLNVTTLATEIDGNSTENSNSTVGLEASKAINHGFSLLTACLLVFMSL